MDQKPTEYFKELVESAVSRQQVRANELTTYYLVDLLCRFMRPDQRIPFSDDPGEPLPGAQVQIVSVRYRAGPDVDGARLQRLVRDAVPAHLPVEIELREKDGEP